MDNHKPASVPTHNDVPAAVRKEMALLLNKLLANAADMYSHSKQAHWNVRGKDFFSLHKLFDKVSVALLEHADEIAERTGQLGFGVSGTIRQASRATGLDEYPLDLAPGDEHVEQLSTSLGQYNKHLRDGIEKADKAGDAVTTDILTRLCGATDKLLWFVESHGTKAGEPQVRKSAAA